ncbi:MAG TPA: serine/threonine-protein kinase [Blastocatellia bacterium]|nr:serine/threonine-protein kinase [Blastocatellia bacterium]
MGRLALKKGKIKGRYRVDSSLGDGSYAEILLAYDLTNREEVIIKALNTSLQGTPEPGIETQLLDYFRNEIIVLNKVIHPNIIRMLDYGDAADNAGTRFEYIVLEYMRGGDMLAFCRRRPLGLSDSLRYFKQVADALAHAHSEGVIHRDIKPKNLLFTEDRSIVKITDFGVAKTVLDDSDEITRVGANFYAPPEHHPDDSADGFGGRLTPSADIYSLAKTIYTAMTGYQPSQFARKPVTHLHDNVKAEPWAEDLLYVLRKATATEIENRYESVSHFWREFSQLGRYATTTADSDEETVLREPRAATPGKDDVRPAHGHRFGVKGRSFNIDLPYSSRVNLSETETVEQPPAQVKPKHVKNLRRAIALIIVMALITLAGATLYFIRRGRQPVIPPKGTNFQQEEGVVKGKDKKGADVLFVNLRGEPQEGKNGAKLAEVPTGSRVRVLERRDGWARVKVIQWNGSRPNGSPENDEGWVLDSFIQAP